MKDKLKVVELFGGIGAPRKALQNLLGKNKIEIVDYVENDLKAVNCYNAIFNEKHKPIDIRDYKLKNQKIDLLFSGSPCQSFSNAGNQEGGEKGSGTKSSLLWEKIRILKEAKKKPKVVIWENVKGVLNKKHKPTFDSYLEEMEKLGYENKYKVLNATNFGIPQNRNRIFVVSIHKSSKLDFDFNNLKTKKTRSLNEFIEKGKVDPYYYIKQKSMYNAIQKGKIKIIDNIVQTITTKQWRWNNAGVFKQVPFYSFNQENYIFNPKMANINTITARGANSRMKIAIPKKKNDYPIFEIDKKFYNLRIITEKEALLLMGFDKKDYEKIKDFSKHTIYKVAGNSIVVQVLEAIFQELFKIKRKRSIFNLFRKK